MAKFFSIKSVTRVKHPCKQKKSNIINDTANAVEIASLNNSIRVTFSFSGATGQVSTLSGVARAFSKGIVKILMYIGVL